MDFCSREGIDLESALCETFEQVLERDWIAWPETGRPPAEETLDRSALKPGDRVRLVDRLGRVHVGSVMGTPVFIESGAILEVASRDDQRGHTALDEGRFRISLPNGAWPRLERVSEEIGDAG
jgi:hypothetical protein